MSRKKSTSRAPTRSKKAAVKKAAAKKKKQTTSGNQRTAGKKIARKTAARRTPALGRPRVPGTAELDMFFKQDFEARQIFRFLDVTTVKELEQFSPDQITERVISPMVQAVQRIRKTLAMANRHLSQDAKFAKSFQSTLKR